MTTTASRFDAENPQVGDCFAWDDYRNAAGELIVGTVRKVDDHLVHHDDGICLRSVYAVHARPG